MPNEGSTRVGKLCRHQMYGVSCIIEKHSPAGISPGQEECRGAPHPPTCAKPSPHPHRLTDTVAGLVGGAGQLDVHSHRLQAEQLKLLSLLGRLGATGLGQEGGRCATAPAPTITPCFVLKHPPILLLSRLPQSGAPAQARLQRLRTLLV